MQCKIEIFHFFLNKQTDIQKRNPIQGKRKKTSLVRYIVIDYDYVAGPFCEEVQVQD